MAVAGFDGPNQFGNRLSLVAARCVVRLELKGHSANLAASVKDAQCRLAVSALSAPDVPQDSVEIGASRVPLEAPLQFDSPRRAGDKIETGMP